MAQHTIRRIALIGPLQHRVAVHTSGYPLDPEYMLPPPDVVLLVARTKGEVMLFRYTAHGGGCGNTPHDSVAQAEEQATEEYGEALLGWMDVPADVGDAHEFAIRYAAEQLNQREE
jgi:hypothetical protein